MGFVSTVAKVNPNGLPLAHMMLWHGDGNSVHKVVPYNSSDFYTMTRQLEILQDAGIKGVIVTEKGLGNGFVHNNAYELCKLCNSMGILFCILLDPSVATADKNKTKEQNFTDFIGDSKTQFMLNSPIYLSEKCLLDFNTGIDWTKIVVPTPYVIWKEHSDFGWIDTPPLKMVQCKIPIIFTQFFNGGKQNRTVTSAGVSFTTDWNTGVWNNGPTKVFPSMAGKLFYSYLRMLNPTSKYWAFPLNDYDEGSEIEEKLSIETGIPIA